MILLFGSTGMLGKYVHNELCKQHSVYCVNRYEFDITKNNISVLAEIFEKQPKDSVVINCSGVIPQKTNSTRDYISVNTILPLTINNLCKIYNFKFIHITTDCVFDGIKGLYTAQDKHNSTNMYGITKSLGEPEDATVIRTSIIGEEMYGKKSLLEWVISNKNETINGYNNHYWNGVSCLTLAKIINDMIVNNTYWSGVKHICSSEIVSKYDLCCYINDIYNLNINIISTNADDSKNLSLIGDIVVNESIYNQIVEQKHINITMGKYKELKTCRFCKSEQIILVKTFNNFPLVGAFIKNKKNIVCEKAFPLTLMYCANCNTGMIKEIVDPNSLFTDINESGYFYYSSTIPSLRTHFTNLSNIVKIRYPLYTKITEIGCNDGVFISNFTESKYKIIGVDPSEAINSINSKTITKYNTYFNDNVAEDILLKYGKQQVIVCCNCLAHIDNIYDVYKNIKRILADDGVIIIEVHYLKNIIDNMNFDFIYHEHMSYYSVKTFIQICKMHDLYLSNIELVSTHGGSLRAYITHKLTDDIYNIDIQEYLQCETNISNNMKLLFNQMESWKDNILNIINSVNTKVAYGASGRTNMICSYLNIKFDYILDDSINKIGSLTPYFHTTILDSNIIYENTNIMYIFILAWPYSSSIIKKHVKWILSGGVFYIILPTIVRVDKYNYLSFV